MRIVLVGAGVVGFHLAEQLSREGHDISVVDSDPALARRLDDKFDLLGISGDAANPSVLERAGAREADLVVAVTDSDTTNIVVSLIASKLGARKRIVRVRHREFSEEGCVFTREDMGADVMINPIETTVDLLSRLVKTPGSTEVSDFANGELLLWGFIVPPGSPLASVKLRDLRSHADEVHALIVAIERAEGELVIPRGDDELSVGDHIYVFIHRKTTKSFRKLLTPEEGSVDRIVIAGASQLGIELARKLESRQKVVVVDPVKKRAEQASEVLNRSVVLCGEVGDHDFAREYGLGGDEYFLALDDDDQTNLMNSLLMQKYGTHRIGVLAQQPNFLPILRRLDFRVVVTPRLLTVSAILSHIRRGPVLQVSQIGESGAEAREYIVPKSSPFVGHALREVDFPKGCIIGAIIKNDAYQIPTGDTVLEADDHVIVFSLPTAAASLEKLFTRRRFFGR